MNEDNIFEKLNYYYGQLITASDLKTEQDYFNRKRWLINRLTIGCGTVCGLEVVKRGTQIMVTSGVAIDCCGREIIVPMNEEVALPGEIRDRSERSSMSADDATRQQLLICIRYIEKHTHPQPVLIPDCCEERCQYSRIREKYKIKVFPENALPDYAAPRAQEDRRGFCTERGIAQYCSERRDECWIKLARVSLKSAAGELQITDLRKPVHSNFMLYDIIRRIEEKLTASIEVTAKEDSLPACGEHTSEITVTVRDRHDKPMAGEEVRIEVRKREGCGAISLTSETTASPKDTDREGANAVPFVITTTDEAGIVKAIYTAGTIIGTDNITATTSYNVSGYVNITLEAGSADSMEVRAYPDTLPVCGEAKSEIIVTLKDEHDNPVTDEAVGMVIPAEYRGIGSVTSPAMHIGGGKYVSIYTAGTRAGEVAIDATAEGAGISRKVVITLKAAPAFYLDIKAQPDMLSAGGTEKSMINITVKDIHGNAVAGETVGIEVLEREGSGAVSPKTVITNEEGKAQAKYEAGTGSGIDTIIATASNNVSGRAKMTLSPGPARSVALRAYPDKLIACGMGSSSIKVTVLDANNNPVPNRAVWMAVIEGTGEVTSPAVAMGNGEHMAVYTAGTEAGNVIIAANTTGTKKPIFTVPSELRSDLDNANISTDLQQKFKDSGVTLSKAAVVSIEEPGSVWQITDKDKAYLVKKEVKDILGIYPKVPNTVKIQLEPAPAFSVKLKADEASLPADGKAETGITVKVRDIHGNPVGDEKVKIEVMKREGCGRILSAGGITPSPKDTEPEDADAASSVTVETDQNGEAKAVYIAGTSDGEEIITAEASNGASGSVQITLVPVHIIAATAGKDGSIIPSGEVKVKHGSDQTFTIEADEGYHIREIRVDGKPVVSDEMVSSTQVIYTYEFKDVIADHTIEAAFAMNTYIIEAAAEANEMIEPSGKVEVAHGSDQEFTITPNGGYRIKDILVDGKSVSLEGRIDPETGLGKYTFEKVITDHSIDATFVALVTARDAAGYVAEDSLNVKLSNWSVDNVSGVGHVTTAKLRELEVITVGDLASSAPDKLKTAGINENKAREIIAEAKRMLGSD